MVALLLVLALGGLMQAVSGFAQGAVEGGTELAFGYLLLVSFFDELLCLLSSRGAGQHGAERTLRRNETSCNRAIRAPVRPIKRW